MFSTVYNIPKFLEVTPDGSLNVELSNSPLYTKVREQNTSYSWLGFCGIFLVNCVTLFGKNIILVNNIKSSYFLKSTIGMESNLVIFVCILTMMPHLDLQAVH